MFPANLFTGVLPQVWGDVMQSSRACRLWPIMVVDHGRVQDKTVGLHFTSLTFAASDFDVEVSRLA